MKYFDEMLYVPLWCLFCGPLLFLFHVCISYAAVITCLERAVLLAVLCMMFPCVFVIFLFGVPDHVWHLTELIHDLCRLHYFHNDNSCQICLIQLMEVPMI